MTIDIVNDSSGQTRIIVKGIVKSITDSQQLKDTVENVSSKQSSIVVEFIDSFALTSSVIGFLTKKVQADNVNLTLLAHNEQLFELLDMLSLTTLFNVKKV